MRLGIDRLASDCAGWIAGRRVGLVTNQTGLGSGLVPSAELLRRAGADVVALFAAEHGLRGTVPAGEAVAPEREPGTGLPVHSLYGERRAPAPGDLAGLHALVHDVQDIGCRYYTVLGTLLGCAEAAAAAGIPLLVCDRPNPITGLHPEGNLGEPEQGSFVGAAAVPVRHGLTLGELADLLRGGDPGLRVVPMEGWARAMWWDETGLPFVPPSPNAAHLEMALLYPGTCLLEGTNVSEGRGTALPFEVAGAPWIDGQALARALREEDLPGLGVRAAAFRPWTGPYAGRDCGGIQLHVLDRDAVRPVAAGVHLLAAVRRLHPDRLAFRAGHLDRLARTAALRRDLEAGRPAARILAEWGDEADAFDPLRSRHLLYP